MLLISNVSFQRYFICLQTNTYFLCLSFYVMVGFTAIHGSVTCFFSLNISWRMLPFQLINSFLILFYACLLGNSFSHCIAVMLLLPLSAHSTESILHVLSLLLLSIFLLLLILRKINRFFLLSNFYY